MAPGEAANTAGCGPRRDVQGLLQALRLSHSWYTQGIGLDIRSNPVSCVQAKMPYTLYYCSNSENRDVKELKISIIQVQCVGPIKSFFNRTLFQQCSKALEGLAPRILCSEVTLFCAKYQSSLVLFWSKRSLSLHLSVLEKEGVGGMDTADQTLGLDLTSQPSIKLFNKKKKMKKFETD